MINKVHKICAIFYIIDYSTGGNLKKGAETITSDMIIIIYYYYLIPPILYLTIFYINIILTGVSKYNTRASQWYAQK